jgi:hypothetical protein
VHFHGAVADRHWRLAAPLDEQEVLGRLHEQWHYSGPVTLEAEEGFDNLLWADLVAGIRSVGVAAAV